MGVRRARFLALLAALLLLPLAGAACGGDDDSQSPASAGNPAGDSEPAGGDAKGSDDPFERNACELLSGADIDAALGKQVHGHFIPGDESNSTPGQCEWATEGQPDLDRPVPDGIVVFLGTEQVFENTRILAESGDDYEVLDEIGDEAYVGAGEGGVRIGEAGITVTPIGVDTSAPRTHDLIVDLLRRIAMNY